MLNLASETPESWLGATLAALDEVLVDHAHCEKKAAGTALKLLFRYPQHRFMQEPLARLAREELVHFEQVLALLDRRGVDFERQRPSPYGGRLHQLVRGDDPERLVDWLLACALIEARSCERFKLLSEGLRQRDAELAEFYRALLASEARHHQVYVDLAFELADASRVRQRLEQLAAAEAEILCAPRPFARLHT